MLKSHLIKARNVFRLLKLTEVGVARKQCPLCGGGVLIRLQDAEHGVRCLSCQGGPAQMSLAKVIRKRVPDLSNKTVYELSSRGALYKFLSRESARLVCSEYFDDVPSGSWVDGVQCQNVERLTYESEYFDLCTSSDVFEHVADDSAGFAELYRVLKPGGSVIFTVPLTSLENTLERAVYENGELVHIEEPEYHGDQLRGTRKVLCFRTYGMDILDRLECAGFTHATIERDPVGEFMGHGRHVITAIK
jgi:SAM-dependent methyltransferase